MLIEQYLEILQAKIAEIAAQPEPIHQAAILCADSLENGGVIHISDSGHMVSNELIHRAGGLVALSGLSFKLEVDNLVRTRADAPPAQETAIPYKYIEHIFETDQLRTGDVLFVGSVSGKTPNVIELALQAKAHGLTVIGLTAIAYSSRLDPMHPSGKRLYEVADLVLDNRAPYGDAMLEVEGLDYAICPASGIGAATIMWAIMAGLVEEMLARGLTPSVYPSVNRPDGLGLVNQIYTEALQKGY